MSEIKVVSFEIAGEEYALDIMKIDSIIEVKKILKVPQAPSFVKGIMDFRGMVIPVISGKKKFALSNEEEESDKAIVVNLKDKKMAILVDEVKEVLSFSQDELEEPPQEITNESNRYISAIANVNGRMIIVLDIDKLLSEKEEKAISNLNKENDVTEGR
ncbi:chemotaxis protein CheW [Mesoaciditoga lauensis]|uniref:chemotaxis protein CheW n=1 Tax=Mesoaciditoga lauensis TaxID=1495039 RepID=UPI000569D3D7|nr:chemotaxis protein CheW [Mesoaciditoga lauensis]